MLQGVTTVEIVGAGYRPPKTPPPKIAMAKVQFNCRLDKASAKWIADEARRQTRLAGERVSQAEVITILIATFDQKHRRGSQPGRKVKQNSK